MLTLDRVVQPGAQNQEVIGLPFEGFRRIGFGLAPGQMSMIASAPNGGKSALAMALCLDIGKRALYESPDTDDWTMAVRVLAHNTGHPQSYIRGCLEPGVMRPDELDVAVHDAEHVQFSFDSYSTEEIHADVMAYGVIHGSWPELIVVDNLRNVARGSEGDFAAQSKALDELHTLARHTGAHVMVLHHTVGEYDNGNRPIPLSGLENKLSKLPAQILTLYEDGSYMGVCIVKNRTGRRDPSGRLKVMLRFDAERMTFMDQE